MLTFFFKAVTIIIYAYYIIHKFSQIMTKISQLLEKQSTTYKKDIFVFTASGERLYADARNREYKDIRDLLLPRDLPLLNNILRGFDSHPLIALDSKEGYLLIDKTLYVRFGIITAIIPQLEKRELLEVLALCREVVNLSLLCDEEREIISAASRDELNESQLAFSREILNFYALIASFSEYAVFPEDTLSSMDNLAKILGKTFGCDLECSTATFVDADAHNKLCSASFILSVAGMLLVAAKYSEGKSAKIKLHYDENGAYFDFSFEISAKYVDCDINLVSSNLKKLRRLADVYYLELCFDQQNEVFNMRAYPWVREPDSSDIKRIQMGFNE